jgi:predicted HicB family RNase H-like nuclease
MEARMDFDGYRIEVRPEDGEHAAFLLEVPTISAYGASPADAIVALGEAYAAVKRVMTDRGLTLPQPVDQRRFSGRFNVRVSPDLHRELVLCAKREGRNLNAEVAALLAQGVAGRREQAEAAGIEDAQPRATRSRRGASSAG